MKASTQPRRGRMSGSPQGSKIALLGIVAIPACEAAGWIGTLLTLAGGALLLVSIVQVLLANARRRAARPAGIRGLAAVAAIVVGFATIAVGLTDEEREQLQKDSEERAAAKAKKKAEEPATTTKVDLVVAPTEQEEPRAEVVADAPASKPAAAEKGSDDKISAESFCDRLQVLQKIGGGLGMKPGACVAGKKPEEDAPEFQKLARCIFDVYNIDDYRSRCVLAE